MARFTSVDPEDSHPPEQRKKPWYRLRNLVLGVLILIGPSCIYVAWWAMTAKPTITFDPNERLDALRAEYRPDASDDPTVWPALVRASTLLAEARIKAAAPDLEITHDLSKLYTVTGTELNELIIDVDTTYGAPSHTQFRLLLERGPVNEMKASSLEHAERTFELLDAEFFDTLDTLTSGAVGTGPTQRGMMLDWIRNILTPLREIASINAIRMRDAAANNDARAAANELRRMHQLAQLASHQGTFIDHLGGLATHAFAMEQTRYVAMDGASAETLRALADVIDAEPPFPDCQLAFESERLSMHDTLQHAFTDDGDGNGRLIVAGLNPLVDGDGKLLRPQPSGLKKLANLAGLVLPTRDQHREHIDEYFDRLIKHATAPAFDNAATVRSVSNYADNLAKRYFLLQILIPEEHMALRAESRIRLEANATRLVLAIELHRARTGALPQSLADLAPSDIPQLPPSPIKGDEIHYRLINPDTDPHQRDYLLYASGPDQTDDAGAIPKNEHKTYWRLAEGDDYILNHAHRR